MSALFVTATGTEVGKTFVACALIRTLRVQGREVDAFKPVASGYDRFDGSDPARLLEALGRPEDDLDHICPYRFRAPLAPPSAAEQEGQRLHLADFIQRCAGRINESPYDLTLIEGAGGLMSPLAHDAMNLDLIRELGVPVLLVTGSYLGAISHTLTALTVMANEQIPVSAVVISESGDDAPPTEEMLKALAQFAPEVHMIVAPRDPNWAAEALASLV